MNYLYVGIAVVATVTFVWWWFRPPRERRERERTASVRRYDSLAPFPPPPPVPNLRRGGVRSHVAGTPLHGKPKLVQQESAAAAPLDLSSTLVSDSGSSGYTETPAAEAYSGGGGDFGGAGASGHSCSSPSSCSSSSGCGGSSD